MEDASTRDASKWLLLKLRRNQSLSDFPDVGVLLAAQAHTTSPYTSRSSSLKVLQIAVDIIV
jgi:hypothetical protein